MPLELLVADVDPPVLFVNTTVADGISAPEGSVTVPRTLPLGFCAKVASVPKSRTAKYLARNAGLFISCCCLEAAIFSRTRSH